LFILKIESLRIRRINLEIDGWKMYTGVKVGFVGMLIENLYW
jgi:hypothetical protein